MATSDNPKLMIFGGGNGSGKTTLAELLLQKHTYTYLGADLEAKLLAPDDVDSVKIQAAEIVIRKFREGIENGDSLLYETTIAGRSSADGFGRHKLLATTSRSLLCSSTHRNWRWLA